MSEAVGRADVFFFSENVLMLGVLKVGEGEKTEPGRSPSSYLKHMNPSWKNYITSLQPE